MSNSGSQTNILECLLWKVVLPQCAFLGGRFGAASGQKQGRRRRSKSSFGGLHLEAFCHYSCMRQSGQSWDSSRSGTFPVSTLRYVVAFLVSLSTSASRCTFGPIRRLLLLWQGANRGLGGLAAWRYQRWCCRPLMDRRRHQEN